MENIGIVKKDLFVRSLFTLRDLHQKEVKRASNSLEVKTLTILSREIVEKIINESPNYYELEKNLLYMMIENEARNTMITFHLNR